MSLVVIDNECRYCSTKENIGFIYKELLNESRKRGIKTIKDISMQDLIVLLSGDRIVEKDELLILVDDNIQDEFSIFNIDNNKMYKLSIDNRSDKDKDNSLLSVLHYDKNTYLFIFTGIIRSFNLRTGRFMDKIEKDKEIDIEFIQYDERIILLSNNITKTNKIVNKFDRLIHFDTSTVSSDFHLPDVDVDVDVDAKDDIITFYSDYKMKIYRISTRELIIDKELEGYEFGRHYIYDNKTIIMEDIDDSLVIRYDLITQTFIKYNNLEGHLLFIDIKNKRIITTDRRGNIFIYKIQEDHDTYLINKLHLVNGHRFEKLVLIKYNRYLKYEDGLEILDPDRNITNKLNIEGNLINSIPMLLLDEDIENKIVRNMKDHIFLNIINIIISFI